MKRKECTTLVESSIIKVTNRYMTEGEGKGAAYKKYFDDMLSKYGVKSPDELEGEKKKEFFNEVDKGWKADKETD